MYDIVRIGTSTTYDDIPIVIIKEMENKCPVALFLLLGAVPPGFFTFWEENSIRPVLRKYPGHWD